MNDKIITTIITGVFSLISTCITIVLKNYLEQRKNRRQLPGNITAGNGEQSYSISRPVTVLIVAFITGLLSPYIEMLVRNTGLNRNPDFHLHNLLIILFLTVVNLAILIHHARFRTRYTKSFYQLETILLWSSFLCGWTLMVNFAWRDMASVLIGFWLVAAVLGFIVLSITGTKQKTI